MSESSFLIKVPGSTANLGPGFDSIGMAVSRYLELDVRTAKSWSFHSHSADLVGIPPGEDNLVCEVAKYVGQLFGIRIPPCQVEMTSNIPLARGLGSSAAAIVAGIELGCYFHTEAVSNEEKVRIASLWEGHPDNVAASVYGGLVIGTHSDAFTRVIPAGVPKLDLVCIIPKEEVMTKTARNVLPAELPFAKAVQAGSIGNMLTAAVLTNNWELAGEMMGEDLYHQPYRKQLIPILDKVLTYAASEEDIYGAALSGAGPTILCITKQGDGKQVSEKMRLAFGEVEIDVLSPAPDGVQLTNRSLD
ncbi:homoserine kinase [Alkalicoccobacillus murimartini]|uniref:Homoserine kinase n=1 Tax=Alkalicoccobacillus murimartini TaxID=171685 RepID=A0ABT9YFH4_9BACI|nr:homoserine kinase [Alkalicoccobacillus murimartini]MDQ0206599.1 homoserine kinase [Alkalicoccobacillus murimartini]